MSSNALTKIDGALGTLTALQQLNLRGNALLVLSADALRVSSQLLFKKQTFSESFRKGRRPFFKREIVHVYNKFAVQFTLPES